MSFDFKWLRAVPAGAFTGAHTDSVYMGRGTPDLITMWTPFGDMNQDMGTIAVLEGSNHIPEYAKQVITPQQQQHQQQPVHTGPTLPQFAARARIVFCLARLCPGAILNGSGVN